MSFFNLYKNIKFSHVKNQFLAVMCANLVCLAHGGAMGWLSPSLLVLQSDETPLVSGPINNETASWVGSTTYFGGVVGNFLFMALLNHFGRKRTFSVLALPNLAFWIIVTFAKRIEFLYFGRFLGGLTGGGTFVCVPLFVAEIADDHIRGILGSLLMIFVCIGVMISYIAGAYLTYSTAPFVIMGFPIAFLVSFLILPESPDDLMRQNRVADAEKSLRFYKNCKADNKEDTERFKKEWEKVQLIAQQKLDRGDKVHFNDFCTREARIGLLKGFSLISLSLFCGSPVLMNYAALIFKDSGSKLDPSVSSIIMIAIQLIATAISTSLIDNVGRRILLIVSSTGTTIGLSAMGAYTYLSFHNYDLDGFDWVPVTSISVSVFMAYIGLVPLVFVVLMEVLPVKIRASGTSYCLSLISLFMFIIVKFYPTLVAIIHLHSCMWIFAAVSLLGVFFGWFVLEETKGKNINVESVK
ncbi:Facilitated trehalose transporter Tret1 [Pseudolycoriella hygida]|uniref:Facilitated trehalose transporter Tret1 n=1 Tax=Pseudolycoriella hygida TaxID=35572 RepID=A0A9Q0S7V6_9DIPT|nr:Facilitated trehalose transporter Tret1 [Pseudolycoriella hygida]